MVVTGFFVLCFHSGTGAQCLQTVNGAMRSASMTTTQWILLLLCLVNKSCSITISHEWPGHKLDLHKGSPF